MQKKVFDQIKESKILYIILSVFIAMFLWLYVINVENPDIDMGINNISVKLLGQDEILNKNSLIITKNKNPTIDITVRGKRSDLAKLDRNTVTATCDLSGITDAGNYKLNYIISLPSSVSESNVQITKRSTAIIELTISRYITKAVPIRAVLDGNIADGYVAADFIITPDKISVGGPEEIINQIEYGTAVLKHNNVDKDIKQSVGYKLFDKDGNEVDTRSIYKNTNTVDVALPVLRVKELPLTVDFIEGGGAKKENAIYTIDPVSIKVSGLPEDIEKLESLSLGAIDLSTVISNKTFEFDIVLPEGVNNLSDIQTADVSVGIKDLIVKTILVPDTNFTLHNIPSGFDVTLLTQSISVDVRGTEEVLSDLSELNIFVSADVSGLSTEGEHTVSAYVTVQGVTGVGILGTYRILVSLTPVE